MHPALRVVEDVSSEMDVSARDILGKARFAHIVVARREAMRRMYVDRRMTMQRIGEIFDCQHTSVRHHLAAVGVVARCRSKGDE